MEKTDLENFIDELTVLSNKYSEIQTKNDMLDDMHALSEKDAKENELLFWFLVQLKIALNELKRKMKEVEG